MGIFITFKGVELSIKDSVYWYTLASNLGSPLAQNNLANAIFRGEVPYKSTKDAISLKEKSASQGYSIAQGHLGAILANDPQQDVEKAKSWLKKAALQGNSEAQFILARVILKSVKNKPTAIFCLRKSAASGNQMAIKELLMYETFILFTKCDFCLAFATYKSKKCSLCTAVIYCDQKCQFAHWNLIHKKECVGEIKD